MSKKSLIISVFCVLFLFGCGHSQMDENVEVLDDNDFDDLSVQAMVYANNKFAIDLYSIYSSEAENIFFSPYSISTALAMLFEGAREFTADEMADVFYFLEDDIARRSALAKIFNDLNKELKEYDLSTANALWVKEGYPVLNEYLDVVKKYYGGKIESVDFENDSDGVAGIINDWVEDETAGKIKGLIPAGVLIRDAKVVLTNVIYFKGFWNLAFDKKDTKIDKFRLNNGEDVDVELMTYEKEESFNYAENELMQILELPYKGEDLSMIVFLPKNDDLVSMEVEVSYESYNLWMNSLAEKKVEVFLPKFKLETKYFMVKDLIMLGLDSAFGSDADFSGITGEGDLSISDVVHQAFIEVNEEGTEAAAATAVLLKNSSVEFGNESSIPVFKVDHPFVFIIRENLHGEILFVGRVMDPR